MNYKSAKFAMSVLGNAFGFACLIFGYWLLIAFAAEAMGVL